MDYQFSAGVAMAIDFVLELRRGRMTGLSPELTPPSWLRFTFFGRILTLPIKQVRREESSGRPTGWWLVERQIEFYSHRHLLATISLEGLKHHEPPSSSEEDEEKKTALWRIIRIKYAQTFEDSQQPPEHWKEVDLQQSTGWASFPV